MAKAKLPIPARRGVAVIEPKRALARPPIDFRVALAKIEKAKTPEDLRPLQADLDGLQAMMEGTGRYTQEQIREACEIRLRAIWKLGRMLSKIERAKAGPGRGKKGLQARSAFRTTISALVPPLTEQDAVRYQRIGAIPNESELEKHFWIAHRDGFMPSIASLLIYARPYWYKAAREKKHRIIAALADEQPFGGELFSLIYCDPPWEFETFSEKGLERTPTQHYPTMSDQEIIDWTVGGRTVPEMCADQAVMLMWCTSSNVRRAIRVMEFWGFEFKSSAAWGKLKKDGGLWPGTGLIFRNCHEILLYGTKGDMPGPQYQPSSLLMYQRGEHSAKPPEVRQEIERMYPDFNERSRVELFSRDSAPGWTHYGFEANRKAAE